MRSKYLTYASHERLIKIHEFYISKYEALTANYYSLELAKLYKQTAFLIINTGNPKLFSSAECYLERAIILIENMFYVSQDYTSLYCEIYYLYSIIFEHRGDIEKAYRICVDTIHSVSFKKFLPPNSDSLTRQIYLLTKEEKLIVNINNDSTTTDLFEMFQNKRRLFQMYLNTYNVKQAEVIQKELELIVSLLGNKLDKIYIGMFNKDMAKYYYIKKDHSLSKMYFKRAINLFSTYHFVGQKNMLLLDNEEYGFRISEIDGGQKNE